MRLPRSAPGWTMAAFGVLTLWEGLGAVVTGVALWRERAAASG